MIIIEPDDSKLAALAEFAAGAGHEINNPIATIVGYARTLLADEANPDKRQLVASIAAQSLRIRDMIGDVMLFARPPAPNFCSVDLAKIARQTVIRLGDAAQRQRVQLRIPDDAQVAIRADLDQVSVVVAELLRNAFEAGGSAIDINVQALPQSIMLNEPHALLSVGDNGRGISDLERVHLFDPFFSGHQSGRGLGFGLCKCWRIVQCHSGRMQCEVTEGRTEFRVAWPIS